MFVKSPLLFIISLNLFHQSFILSLSQSSTTDNNHLRQDPTNDHPSRHATPFSYPTYCSKVPLAASIRQSPPLNDEDQGAELLQLHLIFRHGARTPSAFTPCWTNYDPHWNCNYDEAALGLHTHPLHHHSVQLGSTFTFRKVYDANPQNNVFGGTCQKGQLISEGAVQHREIGQFLAASYFIPDNDQKIPKRGSTPLLSLDDDWSQTIYFRSTDMQRTRLSASNLLTSVLETAFPSNDTSVTTRSLPTLHTMDLEQDDMAINPTRCPRLDEVADEIFESDEFKKIEERHQDLMKRLEEATGRPMPNGIWPDRMMDCLMSHLCADRWDNIPDALNPNGTNPSSARELIKETVKAIDEEMAALYLSFSSKYSRLGMGWFMRDLRIKIAGLVDYHSSLSSHASPVIPPKLFIWSGHDTTVLPFLASFGSSVWNSKWPPYASLVALEFFKTSSEAFVFRLVFNGEVLTGGIEGCDGRQLCDVEHFLEATTWVDDAVKECGKSRDSTKAKQFVLPARPNWPNPHSNFSVSTLFTSPFYSSIASLAIGILTGASISFLLKKRYSKSTQIQNDSLARPLLCENDV